MLKTNTITQSAESALSTNRVLRNTYALLAATLVFSGIMAAVSMAINPPYFTSLIATFGAIGVLMFVLPKFENSAAGVGIVFLGTGMLGFGLGPMLNAYAGLPNGQAVIATAMGGTGVIFLALSAYVLTTKKSFDFMGGMLFVGMIVVFGAAIINMFAQIPALSIAVSGAIVLLMSGFILFDTSRIVNGGETNYIRATVSMFLNIFNLFTSLLHLLGIMSDD
ncbi:Bax inhibitor-1/YccA family protein [Granulosicoccus antarcticus]|uniref:Modulator of FtsH protease YccA n=1 Tax=Granulosicoccus antarcticus IMCC3135 TaxID=1192854 RepID=A0A2Z2P1R1_9GAMM|nr:Bax inhibitor-1/YccA family protein [Granulosicoccus antarcticus]ASJ74417.1 Modulator of FtsH protease YccA [Granulosicoccus antarcticus IMCC3135]